MDSMGPILAIILLLLVAVSDAPPMNILQFFGEVGGTVDITLNISCNIVSDLEKKVGDVFDMIGYYDGTVFQEVGNFTDRLSLVLDSCSFLITNLTKEDGGIYKYTQFMSNGYNRNEILIHINVTDPPVLVLTTDSSAGHHGNMAGLLAACFSWFPTFQTAAHVAMFLLFLGTAEIPQVISQALSDAKCWDRFNFASGWMKYITLIFDTASMTCWFIDGNPHGLAWVLLVTSILKMAIFLYGVLRPCVSTGQINLCHPPSSVHPVRDDSGQSGACQPIGRVLSFLVQIIQHTGFSVCVLITYFAMSYGSLAKHEKCVLIISAVVSVIFQIILLIPCCLCYKPSSENQCDKTQAGAELKHCIDGADYDACPLDE